MSAVMDGPASRRLLPARGYPAVARIFHWLVAVLVIVMLLTGFFGFKHGNFNPQMAARMGAAYVPPAVKMQGPWQVEPLHKSIGLLVLLITALRLVYRRAVGYPPSGAGLPPVQRAGARAVHWMLYGGLLLQPLIGWAGIGKGFNFFGVFVVPASRPFDSLRVQLHWLHNHLAWALLVLIGVHSVAALFHHYVRKDDVLRNMLPFTYQK